VTVPPLAVKMGETLPDVAGPCGHDTVQFTPALAPSFVTVAENCACAPGCKVAEVDERPTVSAGTVIVVVADMVTLLAEVAVKLTLRALVCEFGGV
jgi:hypothetical protein